VPAVRLSGGTLFGQAAVMNDETDETDHAAGI
jgi:hypothetical protein